MAGAAVSMWVQLPRLQDSLVSEVVSAWAPAQAAESLSTVQGVILRSRFCSTPSFTLALLGAGAARRHGGAGEGGIGGGQGWPASAR